MARSPRGDGGFTFPPEFGFTGSCKGQSAPRSHPVRSHDEYGDGMAQGGPVKPRRGYADGGAATGPIPTMSAPAPAAARARPARRPAKAAAAVPAATARNAALGALKVGAMMGAHAARRQMGGGTPQLGKGALTQAAQAAPPPAAAPMPMPPQAAVPGMKKGGHAKKNFIQGMHLKKGALHRQLGIPEGEKIPESRLDAAAHSDNKLLAKRARTAKMLKGLG